MINTFYNGINPCMSFDRDKTFNRQAYFAQQFTLYK